MAVLLQFAITGGVFTSTTTASGITQGTLANQSLSTFTTSSGLGYATEPVGIANPAAGATSAALAVTNSSYFYFTITPESGNSISLTTLTMNMSRGGAAVPRGYAVLSSIDNYAAILQTNTLSTQRPTWTAVSVDLSGAQFQNVSSPITFRIYIFCPSSVNSIDFDDVVLNGSVASGGAGTLELEGFRFFADDGSESTSTALANQDTNIIHPVGTNFRLRAIVNSTGDKGSFSPRLEFRPLSSGSWITPE